MLENELIDVGFVGAKINDELNYTKFLGDELKLITYRDFDIQPEITISELKKVPLIINQKEAGVRKYLEEKLMQYNISFSDLNIISEIGLPEASLNVIRAGVGCAFIPSVMLDDIKQKEDIKIINIKILTHQEIIT